MTEPLPLDIRPAEFDDAAGIARVQVEAWRTLYKDVLAEVVIDAMSDIRTAVFWSETIDDPEEGVLVLVATTPVIENGAEKERIVGFLSGGPYRGAHRDTDAEIYTLYVETAFHRRGVATGLIRGGLANLRALGHRSCRVWARSEDAAADSFYKSRGAVPTGTAEAEFAGSRIMETAYDWDDIGQALESMPPSIPRADG
ncbi:MAG: GNAT family N-acetyltransferase [Alphaproteobacteria bacterium]|nr:GNAT family N-acetyltransferase [Alphaproteobacteria bacterium]